VSDTSVPENEAGSGASLKTRDTELTPLLTIPGRRVRENLQGEIRGIENRAVGAPDNRLRRRKRNEAGEDIRAE